MEKILLRDSLEILDAEATRPIALQEIKDIYRARARRNESMGKPIQGFTELLAGLCKYSGESIVIYTLDSKQGPYKVFTDEARTEIIGILKLPTQPSESYVSSRSGLQSA